MSFTFAFEVGKGVVTSKEETFSFTLSATSKLLDVASELADWLAGEASPGPLGFPVHHVDVLGCFWVGGAIYLL